MLVDAFRANVARRHHGLVVGDDADANGDGRKVEAANLGIVAGARKLFAGDDHAVAATDRSLDFRHFSDRVGRSDVIGARAFTDEELESADRSFPRQAGARHCPPDADLGNPPAVDRLALLRASRRNAGEEERAGRELDLLAATALIARTAGQTVVEVSAWHSGVLSEPFRVPSRE